MGSVAHQGAARVVEEPHRTPPPPVEEPTPEELAIQQQRDERRAAQQAKMRRLRDEAKQAVQRSDLEPQPQPQPRRTRTRTRRKPKHQPDQPQTLEQALGAPAAQHASHRLAQAEEAYEQEDWRAAWRHLTQLLSNTSRVPEVRELAGLVLYRLERWPEAVTELEAAWAFTGSALLHPVLADSYRAQHRWDDVERTWEELRTAPNIPADVLTEGRIVAAGALNDQGQLAHAVQLLADAFQLPRRPAEHHLRRAYALADCYDQAGEIVQARELFGWLEEHQPGYLDVPERLAALR